MFQFRRISFKRSVQGSGNFCVQFSPAARSSNLISEHKFEGVIWLLSTSKTPCRLLTEPYFREVVADTTVLKFDGTMEYDSPAVHLI